MSKVVAERLATPSNRSTTAAISAVRVGRPSSALPSSDEAVVVSRRPGSTGTLGQLDLLPVSPDGDDSERVAPAGQVSVPGLPIIPVSMRPGARFERESIGIGAYLVTISGGRSRVAPDGSLATSASNAPYVGVTVEGSGLEMSPAVTVRSVYFVCQDGLEGRVEVGTGRAARLYVGQPQAFFEMLHRLVQTEAPVSLRIGYWIEGADIEVQECDIYARSQQVGQRED